MEALFTLAGEVIAVFMALAVAFVVMAALVTLPLLESLLDFLTGITTSAEVVSARRQKVARRMRILKRISFVMGGLLAVCLGIALVLNFFCFESTVRWGLTRIAKRNQIDIQFQSASGNLFKGRIDLMGIKATRTESTVSTFDLTAEELLLDISTHRIWPASRTFQELFIRGLKGNFHRLSIPEPRAHRPAPGPGPSAHAALQIPLRAIWGSSTAAGPSRNYHVDHFRMEDLNVSVRDSTQAEECQFQLVVHELDCRPLRSQWAVFDLLFHANGSGAIEGKPFALRSLTQADRRRTEWEASDLPVTFIAHYFGGPFHWLSGGTADVRVVNEWSTSRSRDVNMQWSFGLKDLSVNASTNATMFSRIFAAATDEYIRQHNRKLDLSFGVTISEDTFEGIVSPEAAGLWNVVRDGFVREFAKHSGVSQEKVNEAMQSGINTLKGWLNRRRTPNADGPKTN